MPYSDQRLLQKIFRNYLSQFRSRIRSEIVSGNAITYYNTSYFLQGMLSAVEATKDVSLLKETVSYLDGMIRCAADRNGDGHLEWLPLDGDQQPYQLYSFQAAGPIARAAAIIMRTPLFRAYQPVARRYVKFVDNSIISYWFDKATGVYKVPNPADWPWLSGYIPWLRQDLGGAYGPNDVYIWNDQPSLLGALAASLYAATGNPLYGEMAGRITTHFSSLLRPNGPGWIWDNKFDLSVWTQVFDYSDNRVPQHDTSHANREPMLMVLSYEDNVSYKGSPVFGASDLRRLANTLTEIIWNRSLQNPAFANYINGALAGFGRFDDPTTVGNIYEGWVLLGKYSPKAQTVTEATLEAIVRGASPGQMATCYGKVALAGHVLRNRAT